MREILPFITKDKTQLQYFMCYLLCSLRMNMSIRTFFFRRWYNSFSLFYFFLIYDRGIEQLFNILHSILKSKDTLKKQGPLLTLYTYTL